MDAMNQNLCRLKERDIVHEPVQSEPRYNGAVDLARFVAAMVIVGIHTEVFCQISLLDMGFGVISRLALPLFFIISAFFFFSKECLNNKPFIQFFPSQLDFQSNRVVMFHVFGLKLLSGASKTAPKAALEALE